MSETSSSLPLRVSLVVPVRDEAATIATLLDSIAAQTRPPEEVVFVDGGSSDGTVDILRTASMRDPRIRIIETTGATPGRGRNIGIDAAKYDWIALTDAGIRLDPRWLERLVGAVVSHPEADIVFGGYEPVTTTFFERCAALTYVTPKSSRGDGRWVRGPFIASSLLRRDAWHAVGGFPDLRAAEDLIFMEHLKEEGFRSTWEPDAIVYWQLQPDLRQTFRRFSLYSRHNVRAGRLRDWHYGVARTYIVIAPFLLAGIVSSPLWLGVPVALLGARAGRRIWRAREKHGLGWVLNPLQFLGVCGVMLTVDAATFTGWVRARLAR